MQKSPSSSRQQVAVLGAGVIGICNAISLQRDGFQVALIDNQGISEGCSKGNAGHFATEQVFPLAQASLLPQLPKMLLDPKGALRINPRYLVKALPWFIRFVANMRSSVFNHNKNALKQLNERAIDAWQALTDIANCNDLFHLHGSLLTFEAHSYQQALDTQKHYQNEGVQVDLLDRQALDSLQPGLHSDIAYALYFTDVGHTCSPHKLNLALFDYAKSIGVEFVQASITQISHNQDTVELASAQQNYEFNKLIVCTGAHSKVFCNQLGYKVPLDTERGYHYMVNTNLMPKMPVVSFEKKFILTPMQEGLRFAGTVEFAGLKRKPNYARADMLKELGQSIWPQITDDVDESQKKWMGFRPTLPDSLPVIGQAPNHPNIYFNFGHQHLGLTLAAISARLISDTLLGKEPLVALAPYDIARFN